MVSKKNPPKHSTNESSAKTKKKPFEVPLYVPPARRAEQGQAVELPAVEAPSLEGLSVTVPPSEGFTPQDVSERFLELARPYATERARSPSEPIELKDEVLVNLAGYTSDKKLIPFSIKTDVWLPVEPEPLLPGLYESMVGKTPSEHPGVEVTLPDDYPAVALRGATVYFVTHIQAVREVTYPDLESPQFLESFGRGKTVAEATQSVIAQMKEEHTQMLLVQAQQQVLLELARRTHVDIPSSLVDEEIRRRWGASEGKSAVELGFSDKEQEESLKTWLQDEDTRQEVTLRLKIALALGAIWKRDGLQLTQEFIENIIQNEAEALGVDTADAAHALRDAPEGRARLETVAVHLFAVKHVMKKAKIHFEGA